MHLYQYCAIIWNYVFKDIESTKLESENQFDYNSLILYEYNEYINKNYN